MLPLPPKLPQLPQLSSSLAGMFPVGYKGLSKAVNPYDVSTLSYPDASW